jgi:D-glycero-D-manno-heptose 1,7-bisphosphate phosphatase
MALKPAVFLDRDGTLNVEKNYLHRIEDWEWITGAPLAIKALRNQGFTIIVVTNQSGIARGMYGRDDVVKLHDYVNAELAKLGTKIDAFYFCPHHQNFGEACDCRKPKAGMLFEAAKNHSIDLGRSWLIGDKSIDCEAALVAGVKPILVKTGHGVREALEITGSQIVVDDIVAACGKILQQLKGQNTL